MQIGDSYMLFRVEIENFFSIRDRQVIDLRVRKSVEDTLGRLSPLYPGAEDRAPNVVAMFGPNAAGKSNVLRAIAFAAWFVRSSFDLKPGQMLPFQKFGSKLKIDAPTRLAFSMAGPVDILDASGNGPMCPYTYELEIAPRKGLAEDRILLERLSYLPNKKGRLTRIFERDERGSVKAAKGFLSSQLERLLEEILRPSASVVSTLAQLNHPVASRYVVAMETIVSNIFIEKIEQNESDMTRWYALNLDALEELQKVVRRIDLGIEEIEIDKETADPIIILRHSGLDQMMILPQESHGTRQFLKVFPFIFMALQRGGVAVIDEIDTAIHPMILPEILRWFSDPVRNPYQAQIWTTCHAATLLSDLTKEEVVLCEKAPDGATRIFGLSEIENVRRDENFFAKYLGGEYGAVPVVG